MVTQGEVTLKSDRLTVIYEEPTTALPGPEGGISGQRLKEIVAEGSVEIRTGDRWATGHTAVFNEAGRTVVLQGNVVLQARGTRVTGARVTVFLDEKRSVVEGDGEEQRAKLLLRPERHEEGTPEGEPL